MMTGTFVCSMMTRSSTTLRGDDGVTFSILNAPPKPMINVVMGTYGSFQMKDSSLPRARVWVLEGAEPDHGALRVAYNHQQTGKVVWRDLGAVTQVVARPSRWEITMADGRGAMVVLAPCVCGAGAVGSAGVSPDPHHVNWIRTDTMPWVRAA